MSKKLKARLETLEQWAIFAADVLGIEPPPGLKPPVEDSKPPLRQPFSSVTSKCFRLLSLIALIIPIPLGMNHLGDNARPPNRIRFSGIKLFAIEGEHEVAFMSTASNVWPADYQSSRQAVRNSGPRHHRR